MTPVTVRPAADADWPAIWPIVEAVARGGETYAWPRDITPSQAQALWMVGPPGAVFVAVDDETVLGSAKIVPNQRSGAHVTNGSFAVDAQARGRGVGRLLGQAALDAARDVGFRAMQFNAVVETNTVAVALWRSLGFEIVGTVPEAFAHPTKGLVALHVMHRRL